MLPALDFRRDIVPFLIATIGEFAALAIWLQMLDAGQTTTANVALWTGFAIERLAVAYWVRNVYSSGSGISRFPLWATGLFLLAITIAEVWIWYSWLRTSDSRGPLVGVILLFVLIHALHSIEMSAVKLRNPLVFALNSRTLFFSVMEAVGGLAWLVLVRQGQPVAGALCLAAGLTIEHIIQGGLLKPQPAEAAEPAARAVQGAI